MVLIESVPHWDSHLTVAVASFWPYGFPGRLSSGEKLPVSDAISQSTFLFKTKARKLGLGVRTNAFETIVRVRCIERHIDS